MLNHASNANLSLPFKANVTLTLEIEFCFPYSEIHVKIKHIFDTVYLCICVVISFKMIGNIAFFTK